MDIQALATIPVGVLAILTIIGGLMRISVKLGLVLGKIDNLDRKLTEHTASDTANFTELRHEITSRP